MFNFSPSSANYEPCLEKEILKLQSAGQSWIIDLKQGETKFTAMYDMSDKESEKSARSETIDKLFVPKLNFSKKERDLLCAKKIWIGMTVDQFRFAGQKPTQINRTVVASGIHEQWVFPNNHYYYFENGKLTSWQGSGK